MGLHDAFCLVQQFLGLLKGPEFALYLQALSVPGPPVQSTVTGLIKCGQANFSGNTEHVSKWRPPYTTVI